MKKTLKILMAIILFAVVLTIATSVNAAVETITPEKFVQVIDDDTIAKIENGTLKILTAFDLTDAGTDAEIKDKTLLLNGMDIELTAALKGNVQISGTVVTSGTAKIDGNVTVYGTVYEGSATATKYIMKDNGVVYSKATITAEDTDAKTAVTLALKEAKKAQPMNGNNLTEYANITVAKATANSNVKVAFGKAYLPGETTDATVIEAKKTYNVKVTVTYKNEELANTVWEEALGTEANNPAFDPNCTVNKSDDILEITINDKVEAGKVAKAAVKVTDTDVESQVALTVGEVKPEDPDNKPEEPNQPEEPSKPAEDGNKGDLDDAASVATGDHIIPATALLAVVVVANVVYFAKSKNN